MMIIDYIEVFYNKRRRHSSLGMIFPDQFENNFLSSSLNNQSLN